MNIKNGSLEDYNPKKHFIECVLIIFFLKIPEFFLNETNKQTTKKNA